MTDVRTDPLPEPLPSDDPKVFVLSRELAEVHLLIDNLSCDPERSLTQIKPDADAAGLEADWVEQVCRINWPPGEEAKQAALLIRAKDLLNQQTRPATGATIAFTLLVTQNVDSKRVRSWTRAWGAWIGLHTLPPNARKTLKLQDGGSEDVDPGAPSRASLASRAYPGLASKARSFRRAIWWMSFGLLLGLVATCLLSWEAAYGNLTLVQLASVRSAYDTAQKRVSDLEAPSSNSDASGDGGDHGDGTAASTPPAAVTASARASTKPPANRGSKIKYAHHLCDDAQLIPPLVTRVADRSVSIPQYANTSEMQACEAQTRAADDLYRVEGRLKRWMNPLLPIRRVVADLFTPRSRPHPVEQAAAVIDVGSEASSVATIISTAVLPFFYGLLGAGAAIIRSLSATMKASLLAPRDLTLSLQRLALGAVVGTCVGLFVTSPISGAQSSPGLLGPVGLSGSALSFVAGYSVDAVFAALEGLINRIFTPTRDLPLK